MVAARHGLHLSRRHFMQGAGLAGLWLLAGCGRLPGQASSPPKVPRVGYLASPPEEAVEGLRGPLLAGLRERGYVEGQNVLVEYRYAGDQTERLPDLAAELVRLPVDVIVAVGPSVTPAAKQATATVPIVMAPAGTDPVGQGLIQSYARPGGNITGIAGAGDLGLQAKRLQLLTEVVPGTTRVAALWSPGNPVAPRILAELQDAGQKLGAQVVPVEAHDAMAIESVFDAVVSEQASGLILVQGPFMRANQARLATLALQSRLPSIFQTREFVVAGGLMAYSDSAADMGRRAAYYVDQLLKGARAADLPVEQPMRFDFVINLQTAQALGLTIPQHVLLQATEVIQ